MTTTEPLAPRATASEAKSAAISVRGLRMSYGGYEAVRGIDLEGFRMRTSGEVLVLGTDPAKGGPRWRSRIGVVLQTCAPERLLSVRECLSMYAGYYANPLPVDRVLELTGLTEKARNRCDQLSGGQQRRLDVALALIGDPELIFLDEPTTGFDPTARRQAWDVVSGLRDLGKTVFLTTHFMDEAEALADRIVILAAGRIVAEGTPQTIGGRASGATVIAFTLPPGVTADSVPVLPSQLEPDGQSAHGRAEINVSDPARALHALTAWALEKNLPLTDLTVSRPSLEDIYLKLTHS